MFSATTTFSQLLGYASIACWLGAQFPQVLENFRRQSCEGLALPFLANWLLGDVSNLIGCILTHQLPFQTYLATYFVFVDCALVAQYFYYSGSAKSVPSFAHQRPLPSASRTRTSIDRGAVRYRTLSAVAANVAASAALAAQQDEHGDHRRRWPIHSASRVPTAHDDDDDDENALAALADSFHSEAGHDSRHKRVSWSLERHRRRSGSLSGVFSTTHSHQQPPGTEPFLDTAGRGRPLERDMNDGIEIEPEVASPNRLNSRASRRAGTMMFLGAWALFGIGTFANQRHVSANLGTVLSPRGYEAQTLYEALITEPLNERVVGRIFAWLCTTLYLTSRLPQIWKNFVRKSVEGLSMYLFVFAFLGNVFYVASILSSPDMRKPPPESTAFLNESIPYLLGSGGTLMFDVTIVAQSFIYRPRPRRHSSLYNSRIEEEAGLLTGESLTRGRTR